MSIKQAFLKSTIKEALTISFASQLLAHDELQLDDIPLAKCFGTSSSLSKRLSAALKVVDDEELVKLKAEFINKLVTTWDNAFLLPIIERKASPTKLTSLALKTSLEWFDYNVTLIVSPNIWIRFLSISSINTNLEFAHSLDDLNKGIVGWFNNPEVSARVTIMTDAFRPVKAKVLPPGMLIAMSDHCGKITFPEAWAYTFTDPVIELNTIGTNCREFEHE